MATDTDARVLNASLELGNCSKKYGNYSWLCHKAFGPPPTYPSNGTFFHLIWQFSTLLDLFGPLWKVDNPAMPFFIQNGPFLSHPQSWTRDPRVKKGSSPRLLCVACLWNPKYSLLEHKYGRNPWKMSKIGQNSMKKWPFFAIILPWMARYGSETSFLLIFSARDDLVKVSWKSDARKCQNQLTPPYFD